MRKVMHPNPQILVTSFAEIDLVCRDDEPSTMINYIVDWGMGRMEISTLPGNPKILVFHSKEIKKDHRNNGWGSKMHEEALKWAKGVGFQRVMCTVRDDNEYEIKILRKHGWDRTLSCYIGVSMWSKLFC